MKEITRSKLVKKLDLAFSTYIRLRDCDQKWNIICPLCWAKIPFKKAQNMHFITRACWMYRYDEMNCHAWCMRCNVMLHGNYIIYTRWMQKKYWIPKIDEMISNKFKVFKITTPQLKGMLDFYQKKCDKLIEDKHLSL